MINTSHIFKILLIIVLFFNINTIMAQVVSSEETQTRIVENSDLFPNAIKVLAGRDSVPQGQETCIDVKVANFVDILKMQYTNTWNTNVVEFIEIRNINLPDMTATNFTYSNAGFLSVDWESSTSLGRSAADSTIMYSICFTAIGNPMTDTNIAFTTIPTNIYVTNVESNTVHIGLKETEGNVYIEPPLEPLVVEADNIESSTCLNINGGAIDISVTGGAEPYNYMWSNLEITEDISNLPPNTYSVTITDSAMPPNTLEVGFEVPDSTASPIVDAGLPLAINCNSSMVTLDGTGSSMGAEFSYVWTASNGGEIIENGNTLTPTVNGAGTYSLFVLNQSTFCNAGAEVEVGADTIMPHVNVGLDLTQNCFTDLVQIDASNSDNGANYELEWTTATGNIVSGGNGTLLTADTEGTYLLTVTNLDNGCVASDSVAILPPEYPIANAGQPLEAGCEEAQVTLDATASSTGFGFVYSWDTDDGRIVGSTTGLTTEADQLGTYTFMVTNQSNGCSSIDSVEVILVGDLTAANAGEDYTVCEDNAMVAANLPEGSTGRWSSIGIANFDENMENETTVGHLVSGTNALVWTLSTEACADYSADTLYITKEARPIAFSDQQILTPGAQVVEFDILENDELYDIDFDLIEVNFINNPEVGSLNDMGDGIITYTVPSNLVGAVSFKYELCNLACADLCDTASVSIIVENPYDPNAIINDGFPNGITPNGDGVNDALIFDALLERPEDYPRNEITIFNRWGDVVYRAQPYQNDWEGTNIGGSDLPQGTYYYIMKLDIANGEIIQGDITILK